MSMLLLQTFLLMLAAFVLGATTACLLKRTLHGFAGDKDDALEPAHIHIERGAAPPVAPPPAQPSAPVVVSADETRRFARALKGDVADVAAVAHAAARVGPVVEVQPIPPPPPPRPVAPLVADVGVVPVPAVQPARDERNYAAIAVASHDGSMLPPAIATVSLPPPVMPGPAPAPLPVPLVAVPRVPRPADAPDDPEINYIATALAITGGVLLVPDEPEDAGFTFASYDEAEPFVPPSEDDGWTYAAIAVASHDGSMLPTAIPSLTLPAPVMPEPPPAALPVPLVAIAAVPRPVDAPPDPEINYVTTALAATGGLVPRPAEPDAAGITFASYDEATPFEHPPEGQTYTTVAAAGGPATPERTSPDDTEVTLATAALAAAAGLAAKRAAFQQPAGGAVLAVSGNDDLTRIQGIDEVIASRLEHCGVTRFEQVAGWTADDVGRISQALGFFGRIEAEYWIDQARGLAGQAGGGDVPPPAAPATARTGTSNASEVATAAAAAAAAAMAASSASRRRERVEAPERPDAAGGDGSHAALSRTDLTGLRSVRSEALLGDAAEFVRGDVDDLKRIRGIGVLIEKKLNSLGVTSYEQVANWSGADIDRVSDILDFKGRIERENWVEQARILASGGQTEFSRRVDKGEA
jgi:predicted flap endonuclease-1-like 5' DNA nuclease